jgi:hypothetical protein
LAPGLDFHNQLQSLPLSGRYAESTAMSQVSFGRLPHSLITI